MITCVACCLCEDSILRKMSQPARAWRFSFLIVQLILPLFPATNSQFSEWTQPPSIPNSSTLEHVRSLSTTSQGRLQEDQLALDSWAALLNNDSLVQRWRNQSTISSPCDWEEVLCGDWEGELRVVGLDFHGLTFDEYYRQMPSGLGKLSGLHSLVLGAQNFNGKVPTDIADCSNLQVLDISSNSFYPNNLPREIIAGCRNLRILNASLCGFQGPIPGELWSCSNIEEIDLAGNFFTGDMAVGTRRQLSNLPKLDLSDNQLSGDISDLIDAVGCSKLAYLDLSSNNFAGAIPPELGNCTQLRNLLLQGNQLNGSIPGELGQLQHLECLGLGNNRLTGTLPQKLRQCGNLWAIDVSENRLSGSIPRWLSEIPSLRFFTAHTNNISGQIPLELARAPKLAHFDVGTNNLTGAVPAELANVTSLRFLRLAENHLGSSLPPALGNLSHLRGLDVSANDLTGPIPPSLGSLQNLRWLRLEENQLTCSLPPDLTNCRSLLWLNVRHNRLSGEIPRRLFALGKNASTSIFTADEIADDLYPLRSFGYCPLIQIWVPESHFPSDSFLDGSRHDAYCRTFWIDQLKGKSSQTLICYWQLSFNALSGTIPNSIQPTPFLLYLNLSHNSLTGPIPEKLSAAPLYSIDLAVNFINGSIPDMFAPLAMTLETLKLSENSLEGRFPPSLNELSTDESRGAALLRYNFSFNIGLEGPIPVELIDPGAYLGDIQVCRARNLDARRNYTDFLASLIGFCDDGSVAPVVNSDQSESTADGTNFISNWVGDGVSLPAFVLGAGVGFLFMCSGYGMCCFRSTLRCRSDRVGVWRPPT